MLTDGEEIDEGPAGAGPARERLVHALLDESDEVVVERRDCAAVPELEDHRHDVSAHPESKLSLGVCKVDPRVDDG